MATLPNKAAPCNAVPMSHYKNKTSKFKCSCKREKHINNVQIANCHGGEHVGHRK